MWEKLALMLIDGKWRVQFCSHICWDAGWIVKRPHHVVINMRNCVQSLRSSIVSCLGAPRNQGRMIHRDLYVAFVVPRFISITLWLELHSLATETLLTSCDVTVLTLRLPQFPVFCRVDIPARAYQPFGSNRNL